MGGYALGSVEGRVAIQYVNAPNPKDNFTFKCHRSNGVTDGFQDIYAVNDIAFHPAHGTLATVGSDGRFSFWDKDARTKLKTSEPWIKLYHVAHSAAMAKSLHTQCVMI